MTIGSLFRRMARQQPSGGDAPGGSRSHVFVTGVSRSGTTALTELLNRHPDVAIGFERYNRVAKAGGLTPALFETARFRDIQEGDTHRTRYVEGSPGAAVLDRIADASVVGDKIPGLYNRLDQLEAFENARVIFIVREPNGVANSFEGRAQEARTKGGKWPVDRDYTASIVEFNGAMQAILDYVDSGKPYFLLDYNRFFFHREGLDELWAFLGVDPSRLAPLDDILEKADALARAADRPDIAHAVALGADFDAFRRVSSLDRTNAASVRHNEVSR